MGRGGGGVGVEEESQVSVLGTVLCEGATRNVLSEQTSFSSLSLSHVCPCSLVGVGTLLVRVPGMGWGNNREQGGAGADGRGKAAGTWLATWGGGGRKSVWFVARRLSPVCAGGMLGSWDLRPRSKV